LSDRLRVDPDSWLAGVLGRPAFRVSVLPAAENNDRTAPGSPERCEAPGFYFAKVPSRSVGSIQALTALGFHVVDVNVVFERAPAALEAPQDVLVRDFQEPDQDAVLEIAASAFIYDRFHLDPQMPHAAGDAVKREWVRNYALGHRGERLAVAVRNGEPAGFLASLAVEAKGERIRVIDLIGVAKAHQGHGVGRALVNDFIASAAGRFDRLRVGTQVANIPSVRLYEQCGFRFTDSSYVLHAHRFEEQAAE
jgi:ribosomal protein S18 acetylase RimI-like enzyme